MSIAVSNSAQGVFEWEDVDECNSRAGATGTLSIGVLSDGDEVHSVVATEFEGRAWKFIAKNLG